MRDRSQPPDRFALRSCRSSECQCVDSNAEHTVVHLETLDAQKLWDRGHALKDAWLDTRDKQELKRYMQLQSDRARAAFRYEKWLSLGEMIALGRLIAVGIKELPLGSAPLEVIPRHLFSAASKIAWADGTLEVSGLRFVEIRIARPLRRRSSSSTSEKVDGENLPLVQYKKKPGPTPKAGIIIEKYHESVRAGMINSEKSVKDIWRQMVPILEKDLKNFPRGRGLSYPSFARAIAAIETEE